MRILGVLQCRDCGGRHEIHVNRGGRLVSLVSCPKGGGLGEVARQRVGEMLAEAAHELGRVQRMVAASTPSWRDVAPRIDEVHRRLARIQDAIERQARRG